MFCAGVGGPGSENMRRRGRGVGCIISQQPCSLTMNRCTRSYHASMFGITCLCHLHTEHQRNPHCQKPPPTATDLKLGRVFSLIKHLFSCQWEAEESKLYTNNDKNACSSSDFYYKCVVLINILANIHAKKQLFFFPLQGHQNVDLNSFISYFFTNMYQIHR